MTDFWETFHDIFLYILSVAEEIFFHISLCWGCLIWGLNRGLFSNKPTHCLLDYDNYNTRTITFASSIDFKRFALTDQFNPIISVFVLVY